MPLGQYRAQQGQWGLPAAVTQALGVWAWGAPEIWSCASWKPVSELCGSGLRTGHSSASVVLEALVERMLPMWLHLQHPGALQEGRLVPSLGAHDAS